MNSTSAAEFPLAPFGAETQTCSHVSTFFFFFLHGCVVLLLLRYLTTLLRPLLLLLLFHIAIDELATILCHLHMLAAD